MDVREGFFEGFLRPGGGEERLTQQDSVSPSALLAYVASELRSGRSPEDVRADLLKREVAESAVDELVAQARAINRGRALRAGAKYLAIGLGCLGLGAVITAATYTRAMRQGGVYVVTIGLFGFGVGYTVGGVIRLIAAAVSGK